MRRAVLLFISFLLLGIAQAEQVHCRILFSNTTKVALALKHTLSLDQYTETKDMTLQPNTFDAVVFDFNLMPGNHDFSLLSHLVHPPYALNGPNSSGKQPHQLSAADIKAYCALRSEHSTVIRLGWWSSKLSIVSSEAHKWEWEQEHEWEQDAWLAAVIVAAAPK